MAFDALDLDALFRLLEDRCLTPFLVAYDRTSSPSTWDGP